MKKHLLPILAAGSLISVLSLGCKPQPQEQSKASVSIWERIPGIGPIIAARAYQKAFEERKTCHQRPTMEAKLSCEANYFRQLCDFVEAVRIGQGNSSVLASQARAESKSCGGDPGALPLATTSWEPQVCFSDYAEGDRRGIESGIDKGRICFKVGAVVSNLGPHWNDTFARVEVFHGAKVRAFKDTAFRGKQHTWSESQGLIGTSLRDKISSFYIYQ